MAEVATSPPGMPTELYQLRPGVVSIPAIEIQLMFSSSANEKIEERLSQRVNGKRRLLLSPDWQKKTRINTAELLAQGLTRIPHAMWDRLNQLSSNFV